MSSHQEFAAFKRPLHEVVKATNNFADENLIGQGGFGKVYKGNLLVAGKPTDIAARRLHYDYGQGDLEFWNQISMLASLKHDNLVSFIGFCDEVGEKIIINKHEVNRSLDKYLRSLDLSWMQRLQICVDVANALNYIHCGEGHDSSVIHRNIKSSKILLDENWKPKLCGFEHSKRNTRARRHRLVLAETIGTIGYVDPTYETTGFVTHKSDVYSFGVVLFEVICGRRACVPDEWESRSPQYFTEQDQKDEKPDVMGNLDDEIVDDSKPSTKENMKESPPLMPIFKSKSRLDEKQPSLFVDRQPSSFGYAKASSLTEQDQKDGKPDVMGNLDDEIADNSNPSTEEKLKESPPLRRKLPLFKPKSRLDEKHPSLFVDGQPSSFSDGNSSSFSEQDQKDEKWDVMGNLDDEIVDDSNPSAEEKLKESPPLRRKRPLFKPKSRFGEKLSFFGDGNPSPFSEQDQKDGKPDVMGNSDDEIADDSNLFVEVTLTLSPPHLKLTSRFAESPPSSFVDGQAPKSFVDGKPSSFGEGLLSSFGDGGPHRQSFGVANSNSLDPPGPPRKSYFLDKVVSSLRVVLSKVICGKRSIVPDGRESYNAASTDDAPLFATGTAAAPVADASFSVLDHTPLYATATEVKRFVLEPWFTMKKLDHYMRSSPNEELLAQVAKSHYDEENLHDIIDPALRKQMNPKSFKIFSETAYHCLNEKRVQRPNIDQVLKNLDKALELQFRHENPVIFKLVRGEHEGTTLNRREERHFEHLKIPFNDIQMATNNFTNIPIGSGGYGDVYRAKLQVPIKDKITGEYYREWRTVAIKCIREDEQGKQGFDAEIELLTSCKHTNIVSLLGFCDEGSSLILIYEHESNRSLDDYLGSTDSSINLTWIQRIRVGIDIAYGLNYIHTRVEDEQRIVHRDIKSANILLSKNWVAKIADFGLSRFHGADQKEKSVLTRIVAGTECYVCPEHMNNGRLKTAVDIYSFGVVLFELLSGKLAYDQTYIEEDKTGIAYVARRRYKERTLHEMVDPKIMEEVDELTSTLHKGPNQETLKIYFEIAHRCLAITQDGRPLAKEIIDELEKALSLQENNKDNLQIPFEDIRLATQNFSRKNLIGGGGFGKVFKGEVTLGNGNTTIVAKRLDRRQGQGEHHFLTELEILFEYKHKNIIGLEGYCNENNEKIIVYEYACNGSLDRHLNDVNLTWSKRLKICFDIACGLAFLHGGAPTKEMVIHRDIKSANILLKGDWKAKISDFGLSAIIPRNEKVISKLVGTLGYVDPHYDLTGFFTEKSDIYSFGVLLFEIMHGKLLVPKTKDYNKGVTTTLLDKVLDEETCGSVVFKDIKEQIDLQSLSTFRVIVSECLRYNSKLRPTAEQVLQQLEKSLEFQEDYEIWGPKLPKDYEKILKVSTYSENYSIKTKKDLYDKLLKGILLQDDKVWFSLGPNGEKNEMVSATTFSYRNHSPHDMWCIVQESRWRDHKVAKMLNISNLKIKINTRPQFLSQHTSYGVHLVFKFCDSKKVSINPMYVDLKYQMGGETLHAYFAHWRDDNWMMIELYRFSNQEEEVVFEFLLDSLSPHYSRQHDSIYVEGIEFRAIDNAGHNETEKSKEILQVIKPISKVDQERQLPIECEEIFKRSENYVHDEKLFSLSEVNGMKHLTLSAMATLCNFSDSKLHKSKPSSDSSFEEVLELLPQPILCINYTIESQMLSQDTEYACYLVFKLTEICNGIHCPVEVRDLLQKNKAAEIVYFRPPKPWNIHDTTRVSEQRKDGWMEVYIWKFNSTHELKNDCIPVNLKLVCYEGHMSGLIICGLEFRPM